MATVNATVEATNSFGGAAGHASMDAGYIILCSFIVFTMQSGFGLLESGMCTRRSQANVMAKNMIDVSLGGIAYWFVGYGFSFGPNTKPSNRMGGEGMFILDVGTETEFEGFTYVHYLFHLSFATATATITSGGVAERIKLPSYMIYAMINTALIYTFPCHWVWHPEGFMVNVVNDFSGSSVVHMCGGASALAGMLILGPRLGRFTKDPKFFAYSNPVNVVLGTFFLWWGWVGFNGGAQGVMSGIKWQLVGRILVVTMNAAMAGAASSIILSLILSRWRKYTLDIGEMCAALLGGLVAICAPCATILPWEALVIGFIAGLVTIGFVRLLIKLKIDDPVGCFAVHWGAGLWGMIATGFFSHHPDPNLGGVFRGGNGRVIGWNILCCLIISVWAFGIAAIVFIVLKYTIGLRVPEEEEIDGADPCEHNVQQPYDDDDYRRAMGRTVVKTNQVGSQNDAMDIEMKGVVGEA